MRAIAIRALPHAILGSGGIFTAGNDIADFLATARGADGLAAEVVRFVRALPTVAKPVIAGVDGPAVGIGTTLLLHCDLVYATPGASFATPFLDLGLVPEAGSSLLMPGRMGRARAFEMLVLGEIFTAERAREAVSSTPWCRRPSWRRRSRRPRAGSRRNRPRRSPPRAGSCAAIRLPFSTASTPRSRPSASDWPRRRP